MSEEENENMQREWVNQVFHTSYGKRRGVISCFISKQHLHKAWDCKIEEYFLINDNDERNNSLDAKLSYRENDRNILRSERNTKAIRFTNHRYRDSFSKIHLPSLTEAHDMTKPITQRY